jgi:hypothetical protein
MIFRKLYKPKPLGRFENNINNKQYNIHVSVTKDTDEVVYFYLLNNKRIFITEDDLENIYTIKVW